MCIIYIYICIYASNGIWYMSYTIQYILYTVMSNICVHDILMYYALYNMLAPGRYSMEYGQLSYWETTFQEVWLSWFLIFEGWNSPVHRGVPRKIDPEFLGEKCLSMRLGCGCPYGHRIFSQRKAPAPAPAVPQLDRGLPYATIYYIRYMLYTIYCMIYTIYYILYTIYYILYTIYAMVYNI